MSFFITGDTHGNFTRLEYFTNWARPTGSDTLIILGDAALNYFADERDRGRKQYVSSYPFSTFCVHGNHEMRPQNIPNYKMKEWHGGQVWCDGEYPILFAKDGEIYDFDGLSCIVIGGAYSVDKEYRLKMGYHWFPDEQPSEEIKRRVEEQLEAHDWKVDVVLSHTCPYRYMPTETFIPGLDQSKVDNSTEIWLGEIEEKLNYKRWYCGHYHTEKKIDKMTFLYKSIVMLN